jgi:hypothetical protein
LRLLRPFGSAGSRDGLRCHEARFGMLLDGGYESVPASGCRQRPYCLAAR